MDFISPKLTVKADKAVTGTDVKSGDEEVFFTASEQYDEAVLYEELNRRLKALEKSLEEDSHELESIRQKAAAFRLYVEEHNEVLTRIEWLERLYRAKECLEREAAPDEAARLLVELAPVQSSPMKNALLEKLSAVRSEAQSIVMEKAMVEAGEVFVNLGKYGRQWVLEQVGTDGTMDEVRKSAAELETSVEELNGAEDSVELQNRLDQLPLHSFHELSSVQKAAVAKQLLSSNSNWGGLAALEREIGHWVKKAAGKETIEAADLEKYIKD